MGFGIEGKIALIAGAAGDIGKDIVRALLEEGCQVAATGTNLQRLQKTLDEVIPQDKKGNLLCLQMEITDSQTISAVLSQIEQVYGHLDILINSAGILCRESFFNTAKKDVTDSFNINTIGAFDLCQQAALLMSRQKSGTIINIGSQNGLTAMENRIAYSGSKAAITMMTKTMALELAEYGITVNMVAPGIVDSSMALERLNTPELRAEFERYIPLGRLVAPSDVSSSVLFMASPYASCITGTVLLVDGGLLIRQSLPK